MSAIGLVNRHGDINVLTSQETPYTHPSSINCNSVSTIFSSVWHGIFGHPSLFVHKNLSSLFPYIQNNINKDLSCHLCHLAKHKRLSYAETINTTSHAFDMLHVDIWGPYSTTSITNHRYFLTLVDDYTRFTRVISMTHKSETRKYLINFISFISLNFLLT